jgi:hypothetical protein
MTRFDSFPRSRRSGASKLGRISVVLLLTLLAGSALLPVACGSRENWERYLQEREAFARTSAEVHARLLDVLVRQMPPDMAPWLDMNAVVGGGSIQGLHEMSERLLEDQERQIHVLQTEIDYMEMKIEESRKVPLPFESPGEMYTRSSDLYFELKRVEYLKWRRP